MDPTDERRGPRDGVVSDGAGLPAFAGHAPGIASPLAQVAARERRDVFRVGAWVSIVCAISGVTYSVLTWDEPRRGAIVAFSVAGVLGGVVPGALLLRSASAPLWWPRFQLAWSAAAAAAITTIVMLDGGARSPFIAGLLLVQLYAALFYPTRMALATAAVNATLMVGIVVASPPEMRPIGIAVLFGLPLAAGMAAFHARTQRRSRVELDRLARLDPLTGTLNRRGFAEAMELAVVDARARERDLMLLFVDLDGFKAVNDERGHAAGDDLLRWVGSTLEQAAPTQAVGRVGGDEFAVLVAGEDVGPADVADDLGRALAERTAASIGAAAFPSEAVSAPELLALADARAYAEKPDAPVPGAGR